MCFWVTKETLTSNRWRRCSCRARYQDFPEYQKQFRERSRGLQYMLDGLGGIQVRYAKIVPGAAAKQLSLSASFI